MPLPETWNGVFYDQAAGGDMIYDLSPQGFAEMVAGVEPDNVEFLIAGAVYDLLANGDRERANEYLGVARGKFPDAPWGELPAIAEAVTHPTVAGVDSLSTKVYGVVQVLFGDRKRVEDITDEFWPDGEAA